MANLSATLRRLVLVVLSVVALAVVSITLLPAPAKVARSRAAVENQEGTAVPARRPSPHETTEIVTKSGRIAIEYGRPFKRGRKIWGELVPWMRWWMPGADEATILRSDHRMVIGDLSVPAGEYTLYMWVDPEKPKLIVNRQVGQSHHDYDSSQDVGRVDLIRTGLDTVVDQMTFVLEESGQKSGTISLLWDRNMFSVHFVSR